MRNFKHSLRTTAATLGVGVAAFFGFGESREAEAAPITMDLTAQAGNSFSDPVGVTGLTGPADTYQISLTLDDVDQNPAASGGQYAITNVSYIFPALTVSFNSNTSQLSLTDGAPDVFDVNFTNLINGADVLFTANIFGTGTTPDALIGDGIPQNLNLAELPLTSNFNGFVGGSGVFVNGPVTDITPVPEPGTLLLMGLGLAGLSAAGGRRKQQPAASRPDVPKPAV